MLDSEGEQSDQKSGASSYATAIYAPPASAHVVPAVVAIGEFLRSPARDTVILKNRSSSLFRARER